MADKQYLLKVNKLKTWFPIKRGLLQRTIGHLKAVDGVSFGVPQGKSLGLVGESGCGKTTVARTIMRLLPATSGQAQFEDLDVLTAKGNKLAQLRRDMSIVFQDPYGSLNPRMTVADIVGEPMHVHKKITGTELTDRVASLLKRVGLAPEYINRYPHEFSGGQRQRVGIARALSLGPKLVICDEPVSALDVSIQSQILNLLKDLQDEFGLTYLFIAHDLAVVEFFCDTVAVMYMGRIVEQAPAEELYENPRHPYTRTLLAAIPQVDTSLRGRKAHGGGEVPSLMNRPAGCPFHLRCPMAEDICRQKDPSLEPFANTEDHLVSCWICQKSVL